VEVSNFPSISPFHCPGLTWRHSNRRLDNHFNILEGITRNWIFLAISAFMCAAQVLIVFVGSDVFQINDPPEGRSDPQGPVLWAVAIVLGFISIPVGMVIRLIPDQLLEKCIPQSWLRRAQGNVPGVTVSDEEAFDYLSPLTDVRDELAFLKRVKGGRINNLKFAMRHPRETLMQRSRSPSHSRSSSVKMPTTPTREDSFGSMVPPTPESRKRSKSMRSRSNSALGAPTVMAGIVAAGVAAGWSPMDRSISREDRDNAETNTPNSLIPANPNNGSNSGSQAQNPSRTPTV
jgi:P-type Ca2+ transporter type 2C